MRLPLGAHPGNTGGKPGRSGRPPLAFKVLAKEVLESPETQEAIRQAASAPFSKGFGGLIKTLAAYAEGMPAQAHTHSAPDGGPIGVRHTIAFGNVKVEF